MKAKCAPLPPRSEAKKHPLAPAVVGARFIAPDGGRGQGEWAKQRVSCGCRQHKPAACDICYGYMIKPPCASAIGGVQLPSGADLLYRLPRVTECAPAHSHDALCCQHPPQADQHDTTPKHSSHREPAVHTPRNRDVIHTLPQAPATAAALATSHLNTHPHARTAGVGIFLRRFSTLPTKTARRCAGGGRFFISPTQEKKGHFHE